MVKDFALIRVALDSFAPLVDYALARSGKDLCAHEDAFQSCVGQLACDFGWRRALTCKLADLEFPKVSVLSPLWRMNSQVVASPKSNLALLAPGMAHTNASVFKFTASGDLEILLSQSTITLRGGRPVLRLPVYIWLFCAALTKFPALRGEIRAS